MDTKNKVILITGASSGFGKLTAKKLLDKGYTVYAAARRVEKMEDIKEKGAHILNMDVTKNDTIVTGVDQIIKEQGRIDVLLNNAGYGSYGIIETVPIEELQKQYDINVFGIARVLQAVLPYMRKQKSGRIIITSSLVSHISTLGLGWYASSKHALRAMSVALRQEVKDLGIDVVMIEPGTVKTEFDTVAFATLDKITPPADYRELQTGFKNFVGSNYAKSPGPESTADAMVKAVTARKPRLTYRTTTEAKVLPRVHALLSARIFDHIIRAKMKKAAK